VKGDLKSTVDALKAEENKCCLDFRRKVLNRRLRLRKTYSTRSKRACCPCRAGFPCVLVTSYLLHPLVPTRPVIPKIWCPEVPGAIVFVVSPHYVPWYAFRDVCLE